MGKSSKGEHRFLVSGFHDAEAVLGLAGTLYEAGTSGQNDAHRLRPASSKPANVPEDRKGAMLAGRLIMGTTYSCWWGSIASHLTDTRFQTPWWP